MSLYPRRQYRSEPGVGEPQILQKYELINLDMGELRASEDRELRKEVAR
jgi:hypothetical protein